MILDSPAECAEVLEDFAKKIREGKIAPISFSLTSGPMDSSFEMKFFTVNPPRDFKSLLREGM